MAKKRQDIHYRKAYEQISLRYAHIEIVELETFDNRTPYKRIEVYGCLGVLVWQFELFRGPYAGEAWRLNLQHAKDLLRELKKSEVPPKKKSV
jgi:hypothetical protein